jgi:exonuclease SbcD
MFRFLHSADLHLDTPFLSVGAQLPDAFAAVLREASLRAFDALVQHAIDLEVAFVLLAGDIYDGAERGVRAQRRFLTGLERLDAAGIRTFVVHGNHDPIGEGWKAIDRWPPLVHVFAAADPSGAAAEAVSFEVAGEAVTVHGVSYAERHTTENLSRRFPTTAGPGFQVGLLHANIGGGAGEATGHQPYSPASITDLTRAGVDYWALGHVHTRQVLRTAAPWIVYPGNLQGRSTKTSELGAKGAVVVTVDAGRVQQPEFVPLDVVRFLKVEVDIGTLASVQALLDSLEFLANTSQHDQRSLLVRATIRGTGPLHHELTDPLRRAEVLRALQIVPTVEPFVWFDHLEWRTRAPIDLDERRRGNDFVAALLAVADDPEALRRLAPEIPHELRRLLGPDTPTPDTPTPDDPSLFEEDLLAQAIALALDLTLADHASGTTS